MSETREPFAAHAAKEQWWPILAQALSLAAYSVVLDAGEAFRRSSDQLRVHMHIQARCPKYQNLSTCRPIRKRCMTYQHEISLRGHWPMWVPIDSLPDHSERGARA
jgi:hypothetical protein